MFAWRLVRGGGNLRVAASPAPATSDYNLVLSPRVMGHLADRLLVVEGRADRILQDAGGSLAAGLVRTFPVTSSFRLVLGVEPEMHQCVVSLAPLHDDGASFAAVSTGRTAPGHVL